MFPALALAAVLATSSAGTPPCKVSFIAPTPECGSTLIVTSGQTLTFQVCASDPTCKAPVLLEGALAEIPGAVANPTLPTSGNPVCTTITWTPTVDNVGTHNIVFHATSGCCPSEAFCNFTVQVMGSPKGCTLTPGYWKNHPCNWPLPFVPGMPDPTDANHNGVPDDLEGQCAQGGNSPWKQCPCDPTNTINLGNNLYDQCQLLCVLDMRTTGNAIRILTYQLIATKLNKAAGATTSLPVTGDPSNPFSGLTVDQLIAEADTLIGNSNVQTDTRKTSCTGHNVDPIGCAMVEVAALLDAYNNGLGGVPHCN
jgi:hypothetical protein